MSTPHVPLSSQPRAGFFVSLSALIKTHHHVGGGGACLAAEHKTLFHFPRLEGEVLAHLDICENYLRLPLVPVSEKLSDKIRKYLVEEDFLG